MAKNASHADGNRGGSRVTREVGQRGNTRPRADASVRRARRMETDGRLKRAAEEVAEHEARLARLAEALADQPHVPFYLVQEAVSSVALDRDETHVVGEPTPPAQLHAVKDEAPRPQPSRESLHDARDLLWQGYHVNRVADLTGVSASELRHLVARDGYAS